MANNIELSGFINNVKELPSGMSVGTLSVGIKNTKAGEGEKSYKNGFVNIVTKEKLVNGAKVTVKGFVTFDFWEDKGSGKERQAIKVFANEVITD